VKPEELEKASSFVLQKRDMKSMSIKKQYEIKSNATFPNRGEKKKKRTDMYGRIRDGGPGKMEFQLLTRGRAPTNSTKKYPRREVSGKMDPIYPIL